MLTPVALLPLLLAAALAEPLPGAFGFEFDASVPETAIAAAIAGPEYAQLPSNVELEALPELREFPSGWFYLLPQQLPDTIARADPEITGLLTADRIPARVIARITETGCDGLYAWLNNSLARKYRVEDNADVAARAPFLRARRYVHEQRQIDVACGPSLLLQYTDTQALERWHAEQLDAHSQRQHRHSQEHLASEQVSEHRSRQYADSFTLGDGARLQGGLGIVFKQPLKQVVEFAADQPVNISLMDLPEPFSSGTYQVELDPQRVPIELTGSFSDTDGQNFERLYRALRAKYGPPVKDASRHKIFQVNGNFFVLRVLPKSGKTHITLLDGSARRAQRNRAKDQAEAEVAAIEEQFRRETDGL